MLKSLSHALNDREGDRVPDSMPFVVDAHVHVFPSAVFKSVWRWFDEHAWPIRYRYSSDEILDFLLSRGVDHIVALQYAHKPGMARDLNGYMAGLISKFGERVTGFGTVFPGEDQAEYILRDAFGSGLKGLKLHAHVQCFDMNSQDMDVIYDLCEAEAKPIIMHVGREPKSPVYDCDPYAICGAEKLENVIKNYPGLKVCVPHMGYNELIQYADLIERYDNLWLDTAMALADYFPDEDHVALKKMRIDRIMYGTDFPNIPYAWDRELKKIEQLGIPYDSIELLMGENAREFFSIED